MKRLIRRGRAEQAPPREQRIVEDLRALAERYERAGLGDPVSPPPPVWLGDVAAEIRGVIDGAVL